MLLLMGVVVTVTSHLAAATSTSLVERRRSRENLVPTPSTFGSGGRERERRTISDLKLSVGNNPLLSGIRYGSIIFGMDGMGGTSFFDSFLMW